MVAAVAPFWGCATGRAALARSSTRRPWCGPGRSGWDVVKPDSQVIPALVGRLGDTDPVVRLAAHEELRRRTGRDFGYVPWASPEERSSAIDRWRAWLGEGRGNAGAGAVPSGQLMAPAAIAGQNAACRYQPAAEPMTRG